MLKFPKGKKLHHPFSRAESWFTLPALALLVSLGLKAACDLDVSWDALSYHLPFGARLLGIVPASQYVFSGRLDAMYAGFPLLGEAFQALFWKLSGRPEFTNLVNWLSLVGFVAFLRVRYGVPWWAGIFGLLTVPMVLMHAVNSYVDLFANVLLSVALLLAFDTVLGRSHRMWRDALAAFFLLALVANTKLLLIPVCGLTALALVFFLKAQPVAPGQPVKWLAALALACAIGIVPVRNIANFGNPFYPVTVKVAGHTLSGYLSGDTPAFVGDRPEPAWLAEAPQPVRWLLSLAEVKAFDYRPTPYTYDQGWVPRDAPSFRMGGYYAPYVLASLAFLVWLIRRDADKRRRLVTVWFFGGLTAVTAFLPSSQELRYYPFWMLVLVSFGLIRLHGDEARRTLRGFGRKLTGFHTAVILVCFVAVQAMTGGQYVVPRFVNAEAAVVTLGVNEKLAMIYRPGARLCLVSKEPLTFLYAPYFHQDLPFYSVKKAGLPSECAESDVVR